MQINVTKVLTDKEYSPENYSASVYELGKDAGRLTWDNAVEKTERDPIATTYKECKALLDYFLSFGAWEKEELTSSVTLNSLLLQELSHLIRSEEECCNLYQDEDGEWWFYAGV